MLATTTTRRTMLKAGAAGLAGAALGAKARRTFARQEPVTLHW